MTEKSNQQPDIKAPEKNKPKGKMTQFISDYLPLIIFFVSYRFYDIFVATATLIVTSTIAVIYIYVMERRFAMLPTVTAVLVLIFGTATLLLQDENLIKLKSTIIQLLFAVILIGSAIIKKPALQYVFKDYITLPIKGWVQLTWHYGFLFIITAALNEFVRLTQSTDFWVSFKVFGITVIFVIFGIFQTWRLRRYFDFGELSKTDSSGADSSDTDSSSK